ncbi:ABC transporter permease [Thermococcus sp. 21S9]|uniref:ABC transporter permease n=1 Tax=Thermococcus sp. 21S9 TaxID=1638223 RepID=UPI0014388715|nr:ABC transporter permease [Thermococcus sp. 21S9]
MDREILKIAFRNLHRRKLRTFFTMLGIIIAIASITALVSIAEGFQLSISETLQSTSNVIIVLPGMGASIWTIGTNTLNQSVVDDISRINHVEAVNPVLVKFTVMEYRGWEVPVTVMGVIPRDAQKFYALTGPQLQRGQFIPQGSRFKALLGYSIANGKIQKQGGGTLNWEILPGQTIKLYDSSGRAWEFKVSGNFQESGQSFIGGFIDTSVFVPLGTLQEMYNEPGKISFIEVWVDDVNFVDYVKARIQKLLPSATVITERQGIEVVVQIENMLNNLLLGIGSIALIVGALGVVNTLLTSVMERTREIGTYRALGAKKRFILEMILIEGIMLTIIGGVIGFGSGIVMANVVVQILRAKTPGLPNPVVDLRVVAVAFGITFLIGIVASVYPAKKAAELNPAEAIRHVE